MAPLGRHSLALVVYMIFFLLPGIGTIPHLNIKGPPISTAMTGIKAASAASQYGILGEIAPELNVGYWIDENGKVMPPIHIADYRGKVVYLYFFQDW